MSTLTPNDARLLAQTLVAAADAADAIGAQQIAASQLDAAMAEYAVERTKLLAAIEAAAKKKGE